MSDSDEFDIELPQPKHNTTTEITEFEDQELNHDLFTKSYKCLSCFIHTPQLVVKIFEINPFFKSSLQAAYSIVKKQTSQLSRFSHETHDFNNDLTTAITSHDLAEILL